MSNAEEQTPEAMGASVAVARRRRVLIIVENLPLPFDRRVWQEARTLQAHGYQVSIICPKGKGYEKSFEELEGVAIYRHSMPFEASGALGYALEYSWALAAEFLLSLKVLFSRGFDVIHGCNPPDMIFLIGAFYKLFGKKFLFDHHDINPELYEAKFQRRDAFYKLMLALERWTFKTADVCVATNESYRKIAIERGGQQPNKVFVVRSGPDLRRLKVLPPQPELKRGRKYLVGYVGVMGRQEGIDGLLTAVRHIVHDMRRTDIHFGLVGGGTELEAMRKLARELEVAEYVTFTGRVPDAELLAMLNTADVCVNPDVANEMNDKSTMNKIMEYMALGKPIVQYDLTEGRVSAQQASLYARRNDPIDMAKQIVTLLDDEPRRKQMGEWGRERVKNSLAWEHEVPRLLAAYDMLFN
ncbi:glycosyltransferase family 4 protein [Steroidobacter sp. S1-65]|uniref:Glycosyltransferase family 4 protein n=1 Tax=Steroidobacter gossypii TaxID=2805490 RepID=A0ABS1X441_9GAMM|nr:glycosyltransferase family 4 protein [Steroidobacter gossypii]MBM0107986.1 glycosyltransferase family 4 protein [Steroidobacter gossypii]